MEVDQSLRLFWSIIQCEVIQTLFYHSEERAVPKVQADDLPVKLYLNPDLRPQAVESN